MPWKRSNQLSYSPLTDESIAYFDVEFQRSVDVKRLIGRLGCGLAYTSAV